MLPEQRSIKKLLHKQLDLYHELPALTSLMLNLYPSQVYALTHTNTHTHTHPGSQVALPGAAG